MSRIDDKRPDDDHRFDLLVDGELDEGDRGELLSGLDDEPGGWRRCALAFLEAQVWRQGLGAMLRPPAGKPPVRPTGRRWWLGGRGATLVAMAASFLVALFLGTRLEKTWEGSRPAGLSPRQIANSAPDENKTAQQPDRPEGEQGNVPQSPKMPSSPWQVVTLSPPDGSPANSDPIRLPAVRRDRIDQQWLENLPAPMPPDLLQAIEQSGHRIQRRRELFPYRLKNGSQLVVPVDKYEIHYVGRPTY